MGLGSVIKTLDSGAMPDHRVGDKDRQQTYENEDCIEHGRSDQHLP